MDPDVKTAEEKPEQAQSSTADDKPPVYSEQAEAQPPPLPPRVSKPTANTRAGAKAPASAMTQAKDMMAQATTSAKRYGSFWLEHVKKGEMPWTQWFCCGVVGGKEVGQSTRAVSGNEEKLMNCSVKWRITGCTSSARSVVIGSVRIVRRASFERDSKVGRMMRSTGMESHE